MDKLYFSGFIDYFEADMYQTTLKDFNKRSSVTERGGRPYLYTPREIGQVMVTHFRRCIEYDKPFTVSGLCMELGISREGMRKMEKSSNKELVAMIKKGKQIVEFYWEYMGHIMPNPAFAIFVLKNMGWGDKHMIKIQPKVEMSIEDRIKAQERIQNFSEIF